MRVALLADIHGNGFALDAVVDALATEAVDQIVCLGDVAIFGPQPREVLNLIRSLKCPVIMGNTDAWALAPKPIQCAMQRLPISMRLNCGARRNLRMRI